MAKLTKKGRRKSQMLESYKCGVSYSSLTQRKKAHTSKREALPPPSNGQDENNDKVVREQGGKCEDITSVSCQGNKGDKDGDNVGERASLNCMDHDDNDTSDGHGNKGEKCNGNDESVGRGNKVDLKYYGDNTSEGRGNKSGAKCDGNNTSDDRGNKGDPKCNSDDMSNGHVNANGRSNVDHQKV